MRDAANEGKEGGGSYVEEVQKGIDRGREGYDDIDDMSDDDHVVITIELEWVYPPRGRNLPS